MQTFSIGRDSQNQIVLNDQFVSRQHAQLIVNTNGQVMIKDLGSSNGTFVNGNRVNESYLKDGDMVKCASVILNWEKYSVRTNLNAATSFDNSNFREGRLPPAEQYTSSANIPNVEMTSKDSAPVGKAMEKPGNIHEHQNPFKDSPIQQNIIIVGKAKSVGVAFLLAFFFGPLGLLYATITGGVVMFFISIALFFIIPFLGYFIAWFICMAWAVVAANQANSALQQQAGVYVK